MNRLQTGFTLLELMIALAIASILLTVGVPSMQDFIRDNRLASSTNTLTAYLNLARSEATRKGQVAAVCSSNDQTTCTATNWEDGWLIWADDDEDGTFDSPGEIVRVANALKGTVGITGANTIFQFDATGFSTTPGSVTLCDDRTGNFGRQLQVLAGGSVSLTTQVGCP